MSRLFITPREIDFINDLHKEIVKDVIGQAIFLFPISMHKTRVHDIYNESPEKIFENPIEINCRVAWQRPEMSTNEFGYEKKWKIEVLIPDRDMIQREILLSPGDFFSYDSLFYEIIAVLETHNIFGEVEYSGGLKVIGKVSRRENFVAKIMGPTSEKYTDHDAIERTFIQQRGFDENAEGKTGDIRDLQSKGILDAPITGPSQVSIRGTLTGSAGSSFYDEQS